ncbi:MAG: hypothetical protein DDT20_01197 [Firmicutes bacterium]|nr:hypothetical protein [Bacillota bacterium]
MKERLKSLLLAVLVLTSVTMSSEVWLGKYHAPPPPPVRESVTPPAPAAVVAPVAVYVHAAPHARTFSPGDPVFDATWQHLQSLLNTAATFTVRVSTPSEWERALRAGGLEYRFSGPLQLTLLLEAIGRPQKSGAPAQSADRLMLSRQSNYLYLLDTQSSRFFAWENAGAAPGTTVRDENSRQLDWVAAQQSGQKLRQLTSPWRARAAAWVYVPDSPGVWPQLLVSHERQASPALANSFFSDISLVRRVGERDGRVSLTDGVRHVYLHADGTVQYVATSWFVPTADIATEAKGALTRGLSFIAQHGGFTEHVRLRTAAVEPARGEAVAQIQFEFRPYARLSLGGVVHFVPVVAWGPQLIVAVNEREVAYYYRSLYNPIADGASPTRVISAEGALRALEPSLSPGRLITAMYLGFYQREIDHVTEFLYPVWVVEQSEERFLVNAFTADVIAGPSAQITLINATGSQATWDIGVPHALSQYAEFRLEYRRDGQVVHRDQWLSPGGPSYSMTRTTSGLSPSTSYTVYFFARRGDAWRVVDGAGRRITTKAR